MAHMTDSELVVLKARALAAQVSSAHLAHAEAHIMALVDEVLALRGGKKVALKEMVPEAKRALEEAMTDPNFAAKVTAGDTAPFSMNKDEKDGPNDLAVDKTEAEVKASKDSKKKGK